MNTDEHPKALASREKATIRALEKEKIKRVIASHGVHFHAVGRYTFCYRVDKRNVIEVSSAIRHPGDKYDPHVGRIHALARFAAANRMLMRIPSWCRSPRAFLEFAFKE